MRSGEKRIEDVLVAAFDRLPEPDPSRLKLLEERLGRISSRAPRRAPPRWTYWWLIFGLAATGAAAALWGGGNFFNASRNQSSQAAPTTMNEGNQREESERAQEQKQNKSDRPALQPDTNSPTIYRREVY